MGLNFLYFSILFTSYAALICLKFGVDLSFSGVKDSIKT